MEPDDHSMPGLKNIDSSSSSSVIDSISESDKDLVSFFQSLNLSDNQQDNKNVRKDENFDNKETYHPYPLKHGVENCPYYMRTGTCSFGMTCRFNHPIGRATKVSYSWTWKPFSFFPFFPLLLFSLVLLYSEVFVLKVHGGKRAKIESLDQTKRMDCKVWTLEFHIFVICSINVLLLCLNIV